MMTTEFDENQFEHGTCDMCGRSDVPICPKCHHRAPHGMTPGTWLPCWCGGMGPTGLEHLISNVMKEGGEKNEK